MDVPDTPPRVSVLMPTRNAVAYVQAAIDSVLAQTFTDFELIIVDDGSTDGTLGLLFRNSGRDPRIRVYPQQHSGVPRTLNRALELARGEYVTVQDHEDVSLPDRLAMQVAYLDEHQGVAVVGTWARVINAEGETVSEPPPEPQRLMEALQEWNVLQHSALLMRRQPLLDLGGYAPELALGCDYDVVLRLGEKYGLAVIPQVLHVCNRTDASISVVLHDASDIFGDIVRRLAVQRRERGYDLLRGKPADALLR